LLNVVKTPFRSGSDYYPAGTIIKDPAGVALYVNRLRNGFIVLVDEHNLQSTADYLLHRRGVAEAHKTLKTALSNEKTRDRVADEYEAKVFKAAEQKSVDTEGKSIDEIVSEVKAQSVK
jgi:hypothetical protein